MNVSEIKSFYLSQIKEKFLPYWEKYIDNTYGGILNCISNDGEKLLSTDKFTWSQGRWLYIVSKLYENKIVCLRESMDKTYNWIDKYAIDENNCCCFVLTRTGEKIIDTKTNRYDTSLYADCFALIGMSKYVQVTEDISKVQRLKQLADSIIKRYQTNNYLTEPYEVTELYHVHGVPMILENTMHVFCEMLESFNLDISFYFNFEGSMVHKILDEHYDCENNIIREYISTEERRDLYLQDRHINPGHTLEDAWFWIEYLQKSGETAQYLPRIESIVQTVFNLGWDEEYGGLMHYVDYQGGKVKGISQNTSYDKNILETHDMKLWWPHSEMLYLFLLLNKITGKEIYLNYYKKVFDYVFKVFPSKTNGEWVQIRNKNGSPQEKTVALPVKDPFHILRNFIKITELF